MLKVVVIGYGEMLAALVNGVRLSGHGLIGVLRYDRVRFSKSALFFRDLFNPSKDLAFLRSYGIKDINATSVNDDNFLKKISKLGADVVLVGSWGEKIKSETFNTLKFGFINCHPALLPKHRGANPYFWALYNGDEKAGVTFHKVNEKFDRGDILFQGAIEIKPYMNALDLKLKTCKVAEVMVQELLRDLEKESLISLKQDENEATFERQISPNELIIDFCRTEKEIKNHIRALAPYFNPLYRHNGKIYEIAKYKILPDSDFLANFRVGDLVKIEGENKIFKCKDCAIEIKNY